MGGAALEAFMFGYYHMPLMHHLHQRRSETAKVMVSFPSMEWAFIFYEPRDPLGLISLSKLKTFVVQSDMILDRVPAFSLWDFQIKTPTYIFSTSWKYLVQLITIK